MSSLKKWLESLAKNKLVPFALAAVAGGAATLTISALFVQPCQGSLACLAPTLLMGWLVGSVLSYFAIRYLVIPGFIKQSLKWRTAWLATWLVSGALTIVVVPLQPELIRFLFPSHTLVITPGVDRNAQSTGDWVRIVYLQDGENYEFSFRTFSHGPAWVVADTFLQTADADGGAVEFQGSLLHRGRLGLLTGPDAGVITLSWNDQQQTIDLYTPTPTLMLIKLEGSGMTTRPFVLLAYLSYFIAFFTFYLVLASALMRIPMRPAPVVQPSRLDFLRFAVPMLLVWTFYLMVFFPGVLTSDSTHQWRMIAGIDALVDWHPPIYTLLEGLLARIWFSPSLTAMAQIIALSLVVGWGLSVFVQSGLPRPVAWVLSGLMALSPVNGSMVITLWKDIPYAISVVALFIIWFRVLSTQGRWLANPRGWIVLGLVGAATSLFRHNGLVVVVLAFILAFIWFRKFRWQVALAAGLFALLTWLVSGPLYTLAGVQRVSGVLRDTIFLHHIGAHVAARSPLTDAERSYLNQLRPLEDWQYSICRVDPTFFTVEFNRSLFAANSAMNFKIFIDLALRDPRVDLVHTLGSSSMVWRVLRMCNFLDHAIYLTDGNVTWVDPNEMGIAESSLLPSLVAPLARLVHASNSEVAAPFVWGPAIYLYVTLLCIVLFAFRTRNWRNLWFGLIPLAQSLVMAAVNLAADFRYQYAIYLISFYSIAFLFFQGTNHRPIVDVREELQDN